MVNSIDPAYERFLCLEPEITLALADVVNESDTRLKIIDRILFEVMEWRRDSVFTEKSTDSGYVDYLLTIGDHRGVLVIEAKHEGLLRPATRSQEKMPVALSGPVVKPLLPGIRQAMRYSAEKGVAVAVLTDGSTWLFFRSSRTDGKPPMDGKGILFPSLESVRENFAMFVELLNVGSVRERRNLNHLAEAEGLVIPDPEQQFFVLDPKEARMRRRDSLASDAALIFKQFFTRLSNEKDREMLRDCFVETDESVRADFELQKIIQRVINNITPLETGQGGALRAELERTIQSRRSETVLLIGNKGAGKSTFIDRFFFQILPQPLRDQCVFVRVDLEQYHGDPAGVVRWVIIQLRGLLEASICASDPPSFDELRGIFYSEYQRLKAGPRSHLYMKDPDQFRDEFGKHIEGRRENHPDEYVSLLLERTVKGHQKLPVLIFDNTDQFPAQTQDQVYQLAHSYEAAYSVFNVVPITDRTVWRLSKAGALQSYSSRSFYIPVPDAKEIISRRVNFLKHKLGAEPKAAKSYFSRMGFLVELNDLAMLAEAVGKVFVEHDYVSGLIGRLGNFDIRRMLKIAERIFLSPELKIDDIIKAKFGGDSVTADYFRTYRALVKGEYDRFSENENEFISNLFQTDARRPASPLLPYYILWILRQKLNSVRKDDDSVENQHWLINDLCLFFEGCGIADDIVLKAVSRLYDRRLVEALDPNAEKLSISDKIAVKESGLAHLELVLNSDVYIEQMALVTGIHELPAYHKIKKGHSENKYQDVSDTFVRYIMKIDVERLMIPESALYAQVKMARNAFSGVIKSIGSARRSRTYDR